MIRSQTGSKIVVRLNIANFDRIKMARRKFSLRFDGSREKWILKSETGGKTVRIFATKEDATRAGALRKALGRQGGIVTVLTRGGVYEEQRTFPGLD